MPFFHYSQNNSGGFYKGPQNIIVEADSAGEADIIAGENGAYFHGVDIGIDCECCGNRWPSAVDWGEEGDDEPNIYGQPAFESSDCLIVRKEKNEYQI